MSTESMTGDQPAPIHTKTIFTTAEAAELSGLSRLGVIWNITHKHLPADKMGKMWVITADNLATWLKERESRKGISDGS